jgi:aldehyde:ferredoxin oxidoreductase
MLTPIGFCDTNSVLKDLDAMLDAYYELRGWNQEGIPTDQKLKE